MTVFPAATTPYSEGHRRSKVHEKYHVVRRLAQHHQLGPTNKTDAPSYQRLVMPQYESVLNICDFLPKTTIQLYLSASKFFDA